MDTKTNVLIEALDERWTKYRAELKNCRNEFSQEAVHDVRVATRRLLAVMDFARQLDPQPPMQKIRRILKDQVDALDDLRDTQVMLVEVSESMAEFPQLKPFEKYLLSSEKKLLRKTRKDVEAFKLSDLKKRIDKIRLELQENSIDDEWTARLLSALDQAYARASEAFGQIEAARPASIHRFRVRFKKFRYMMEVVVPALKNYPEAYLEKMHDYQSRMGDVQDAVVLLNALSEYTEETELTEALAAVHEAFEKQQAELIDKFIVGKEELHTFWRSAPDQKLPWE
jgi:CHAD domain-containing protein